MAEEYLTQLGETMSSKYDQAFSTFLNLIRIFLKYQKDNEALVVAICFTNKMEQKVGYRNERMYEAKQCLIGLLSKCEKFEERI